jgi:hypothetical protein
MNDIQMHRETIDSTPPNPAGAQDVSGYTIFSNGEIGEAHVIAHRLLDQGRPDLGYRLLRAFLEGRTGSGSDWVHLQWHMAVFELELGLWDDALARFREHILSPAATTTDALTDAPAMLWRLSLSAPAPRELPWEPVRRTAAARIDLDDEPWTELHNVLAMAGAGDLPNLNRWLQVRHDRARTSADRLVIEVGRAMRSYALGDFLEAAIGLETAVPEIHDIGGSRAQNELFAAIAANSWVRARGVASSSVAAKAA